jgi:spermidine synthase
MGNFVQKAFRELDYRQTELGELTLRARQSVSVPDSVVYEVKLNGEFLMSSLVNESEKALARLAMDAWGQAPCDVLVGGLGLGYTAAAALTFANVRHLRVVEYLEPIIHWHRRKLVPAAQMLVDDPRCELVHDDFFAHVGDHAGNRYHLILLDIDHSPESLLHANHGRFYTDAGLQALVSHLHPGGVFALWSAARPSDAFFGRLSGAFPVVRSHPVAFFNPLLHADEENTVIVAQA